MERGVFAISLLITEVRTLRGMDPRCVSFADMRTPEVTGEIGGRRQYFLSLSSASLQWDNYVVEMAFLPAVKVDREKVVRPSLRAMTRLSTKFQKVFVGRIIILSEDNF